MQHNLRLIQLLLDLHNAIRRMRVLILDNILLQLRERQLLVAVLECGFGVPAEELVDDLAEQLVRDEGGVFLVGDDDAGDTFAAAVGVEGVGLLFDVLPLAGLCAFGDSFGEEGHEFADAGSGGLVGGG